MTYDEIIRTAVKALEYSGNESPEYEVRELTKHFFGVSRRDLYAVRNKQADSKTENAFFEAVRKRSEGYPLQYILGSWTFMDCELEVGEGVLIPRDDTEVCVRAFREMLNVSSPVIIDLCSGSGAIAVSLARSYPDAEIFAAELSDDAFTYLERNVRSNGAEAIVRTLKGDISELYQQFEDGFFDGIISNPPYIRTEELPHLQKEVQCEPVMALDGGTDGLMFYRIICEKWLPKLKKGGIVSFETGEDQGAQVCSLLEKSGAANVRIVKDISGLDRTVTAVMQ